MEIEIVRVKCLCGEWITMWMHTGAIDLINPEPKTFHCKACKIPTEVAVMSRRKYYELTKNRRDEVQSCNADHSD